MELESSNFKSVKCYLCKNYLSVTPILITNSGENICGRCYKVLQNGREGKNYMRNKIYEEVASSILFPCKYENEGCDFKGNIKTMKTHEELCKCIVKRYVCPAENNNNCKWIGKLIEIEEHFTKSHPEKIFEHPYTKKPNINRSTEDNLLLKAHGFLFLLKVITDIFSDQITFIVLLLDDRNLAKFFNYTVLLYNETNTIMKSNDVYTFSTDKSVTENIGIKVFISYLIQDFCGLENCNLSLRIIMKDINCSKCTKEIKSAPIHTIEHDLFCENCNVQDTSNFCKNRSRGCKFSNEEPILLRKHEYWICKYRNSKCRWCGLKLENISKLEHYENAHDFIMRSEQENHIAKVSIVIRLLINCTYVIHAHDIKFRLYVHFTKSFLHISLLSNSIEMGNKYFECFYKITRGKDHFIEGKLNNVTNECLKRNWFVCDWGIDIYLPHSLIDKESKKDEVHLDLDIAKNFTY